MTRDERRGLRDSEKGDYGTDGHHSEGVLDHAADIGRRLSSALFSEKNAGEGTGTYWGTVFNILSNVVGGGVLALPYAYAQTGWLLGTIGLIYVGSLSGYAMWTLMQCSHRLHLVGEPDAFSYKAMMRRAFGNFWGKAVEACIVWYTFGCCVTYASIAGTSLAPLADNWLGLSGFWTDRKCWTLLAAIFFAIASSAKNLAELKFTSLLAFLTIVYVILVVVVRLGEPEEGIPVVGPDVTAAKWSSSIFKAIPLFSVSYGCHYNIPTYYHDLKDRNPETFTKIIITAIIIITAHYLVISLTGYVHFGDKVSSYILGFEKKDNETAETGHTQFSADDTPVNVGRLLMFVHFAFVYPLICLACRRSMNLFVGRDVARMKWPVLAFQSWCIVAASVTIAIFVGDIGTILDYNGALFGVFIIVTFPGFLLRSLSQDPTLFPDKNKIHTVMSYILIISGLAFSICGLTEQIITDVS